MSTNLLVPGLVAAKMRVGPWEGMAAWAAAVWPVLAAGGVLFGFAVAALGRWTASTARGLDRCRVAALLMGGVGLTVAVLARDGAQGLTANGIVPAVVAVSVAVAVLTVRPVRRRVARAVRQLDRLSARQQFWTAVAIAGAVGVYLPLTAWSQGLSFVPVLHDELSYAVMARMYAAGRLWMPAHPLSEALETFYVYTSPVYGSMYFPGAGLWFAVPLRLGLPIWVGSAAAAGVIAAMLFRVVGRLISPACGVASVCGLLGVAQFRWLSVHVLSHLPFTAAVMLAAWAYLRWTERRDRGWLAAFAVCGAYAAITRPYDAIAVLALPAATIVFISCRRGVRAWAADLTVAVACVAPFAVLQAVVDRAFTGHWLETPFGHYFARQMPNAGFGFNAFDATVRPASALRQIGDFYDSFVADAMNHHTLDFVCGTTFWLGRLDLYAANTFGGPLVLVLIPLGLVAAGRRRLWVIAFAFPLFVLAYVPYPYFLSWYGTSTLTAVVVCFWVSLRPLGLLVCVPAGSMKRAAIAAVAAGGLVAQPFWWVSPPELGIFDSRSLVNAQRMLDAYVRPPAIVFFDYAKTEDDMACQNEPVYNWQTAWPDDAAVIRVHHLGLDADLKVLRYYQKRNGGRRVYLYDRRRGVLTDQSTIDGLLAHEPPPQRRNES